MQNADFIKCFYEFHSSYTSKNHLNRVGKRLLKHSIFVLLYKLKIMTTLKIKTSLLQLLVISSFSLSAQKVKIKKGNVLMDKAPVCAITNTGSLYKFSELGGTEPILKVEYKALEVTEDQSKKWLIVQSSDGSKSSQVDFEFLSFSLNTKKIIAELLIKKYELIDNKGFNQTNITSFFNVDRPDLTELYNNQMVALTKESIINSNYTGSLGIEVTDSGTILAKDETNDTKKTTVGKISAPSQNAPGVRVKAIDLDGNLVAEAYFTGNNTYLVDTHDIFKTGSTQFSFTAKNKYMPATKSKFFAELVEKLYQKGFPLGHAIKEYKAGVALAEYEKAIANSPNIYETKGYIINDEGVKIEGKIDIIFEKLYDPNGVAKTDIKEENAGKVVKVSYIKTNGKKTTDRLVARDGNRFCIYKNDGSEECYQGTKVIKSSLQLADLGNSVGALLKQYGYFKELKKGDLINLYQEPLSGEFLIKLNTQEKAIRIKDGKSKKGKEKLNEYMGDCYYSELVQLIDEKDITTLENFIKVYNSNPCN